MSAFFPTMRVCADALADVAYAALAGVLLNRLWLGRISISDRPLRICLRACSTVLMLDLPLQYLLLSASMTGDTSWIDAWRAVLDVAATHAGRATIMGFFFVPCLLVFSFLPTALKGSKFVFVGIALEVGFVAAGLSTVTLLPTAISRSARVFSSSISLQLPHGEEEYSLPD